MNSIEYLIIFESIIYGILITQILMGWGKLIQKRGIYKPYWAHILFTITFFLVAVQNFYASQDFGAYDLVFNSLTFLIFVVSAPTVISVNIVLILPEKVEDLDFREVILKEWPPLCTAMFIYLTTVVYGNVMEDELGLLGWLPHAVLAVMYVVVWITKKLWVFEILTVLQFLNMAVFLWIR